MEKQNLIVCGYKKENPEKLLTTELVVEVEARPDRMYDLPQEERTAYYDRVDEQRDAQLKELIGDSMDHYGFEYSSSAYYLAVSYDGTGEDDHIRIMRDDIHDRIMEELSCHDAEYMFLDSERITMPLWSKRFEASNSEEALTFLARAISRSFPFSISEEKQKEMEEYASSYNIPLSIELIEQAGSLFNKYDSATWNTSSKYC